MLSPARVLVLLGPGAVLSHEEAAAQLGLPCFGGRGLRHVTVPLTRSRLHLADWQVHRAFLRPDERVEHADGMASTSAVRTAVDLARVLVLPEAVAVIEAAMRGGVPPVEMNAALGRARGPGSGGCRQAAALVDMRSGSVLESLLRVLLVLAGLPVPASQYEIRDEWGRVVARADLCWPALRLIVEADGFAFHSDRLAYRRDRERMNELERLGWRVIRVTWEDVRFRPAAVVALVSDCLRQQAA